MATALALLQLAFAAVSTALSVPAASPAPRDTAHEIKDGRLGFISFPITRRERPHAPLRRRDNDVPLYNVSLASYLIELGFGTPAQTIKVAIDTGSDELWVNPDCSTSGSADLEQECHENGRYDPSSSSTSSMTSIQNNIPYGKGEVDLQYVIDNITLPDSTLEISQQVFGIAVASKELNEAILGLGYGQPSNLEYPNFVDSLFLQGQTNTRAFSIALGSKDHDNGGTLIFGGVDTKKFTGDLVSVPILGPQLGEAINRYWISLDKVAYNTASGSKTYSSASLPTVLDSGSTLSYLPDSIVSAMAKELNARYDSESDLWQVPCSSAQTANTMDFTFGNATIRVPMNEFVWEALDNICVLGAIGASASDIFLLGDSVMRAGYFVFDQDNDAIHMAQYANCGENEQAIPEGGNAASSFSGDCSLKDTDLRTSGEKNGVSSTAMNLSLMIAAMGVVVFRLL